MISKVTLVCIHCKVEKSTEKFNKDKASKSGFRADCKDCQKIYRQENKEEIAVRSKIYRQENKEEIAAKNKIYNQNNKEEIAAYKKIYQQNNKEEIAANKKIYSQNNREEIAEKGKIYRQNNPHKKRAINSRRRASKLQASPTWTSQLQKLQIEALHQEAVNLELSTGVKFHLDHIHPLNNKYICGLELPCNFQLLTEYENGSKSNKFECYVESELDPENLKPWEDFYPVLSIENLESAQ